MENYPVLRSTLEGIFGARVGFSDEEATSNLLRDLEQKSFRDALHSEMTVAWRDPALSWQRLLDECDVGYFDSEEEARSFVVEQIMKPAALRTE